MNPFVSMILERDEYADTTSFPGWRGEISSTDVHKHYFLYVLL